MLVCNIVNKRLRIVAYFYNRRLNIKNEEVFLHNGPFGTPKICMQLKSLQIMIIEQKERKSERCDIRVEKSSKWE